MSMNGHLEVVGVNSIAFTEQGKSLSLEVVESIPPHTTSLVTFQNVIVAKLFQSGGDEFPLTVIDLTWQLIPEKDVANILAAHGFPFLDATGRVRAPRMPLLIANLEGDLVGDIIAGDVVVTS